ncbi:hypothetical protein CS022_10600 [Veronia nyctiphanis]|uniref:VWFA domain-containing protein n=1 Tax=Veronia nyctiphanis TaxID=1278244 RepID=A0A4Q0YST8_9GAMM|nr:VWA domain-containing protein [Veronia nyctiphanis]RXJ73194.1 hypothetical protein CS022_10600 [Veronia nyctiphanis]
MGDFQFLYPAWFLALIPMAYLLRNRKPKSVVTSLIAPHLLRQMQTGAASRPSWPRWVLAVCWVLSVIALAGPSWEKNSIPGFQLAGARVLVMDMSHSMYTTDIKPNRLSQAHFKALDLLPGWTDGSTGLVAYSRDGYLISPLTDDSSTLTSLIPALSPGIMPFAGSNAAKGIEEAISLIKQAGYRQADIILITDGINDKELAESLSLLSDNPFRVSSLAIGTTEGGPVRHSDGSIFLQDDKTVISRLSLKNLKTLAAKTEALLKHSDLMTVT